MDDAVDMPEMSLNELAQFLGSMSDDEAMTGASLMACGHWFVFLRLNGVTTILYDHCDEEQASRIGAAAGELLDVIGAVHTEQTGEPSIDTRHVLADLAHLMRNVDVPPSTDA